MSSRTDAKNQARLWLEAPAIMTEDLRTLITWLQQHVVTEQPASGQKKKPVTRVRSDLAADALQRIAPLDQAVYEYGRGQKNSRLPQTLFVPLINALEEALATSEDTAFSGWQEITDVMETLDKWVSGQQRSQQRIGNRSDILQTTIEQIGNELFVRTDQEGSTRLRGASNIPMFMAFWQAHAHRLSRDAFRDLDPNVNEKNLERHRVRLCGKLQDVLLEIVLDGNAYQLRRCQKG